MSKSVQRRLTIQRRDPRPISEAAVLKAVKQLLEAKGFRVFRRNTRVVKFAYTSKRTGKTREQLVRYGEPGMADLYGWSVGSMNGFAGEMLARHLEVEIKAPRKKPTKAQEEWLDSVRYNDEGVAFWCDSTEMAEAKLKEWGL